MADPVIDYSEILGKKITCPPECGMCCLCQPEILPEERSFFRSNHPTSMVRNKQPHDHYAIALKKGRGSCVFLDNGRRCTIYGNRPTYCRQFPFHFHVSDRIKVELDLSCRGVWNANVNGTDAVAEAKGLAVRSDVRLKAALKEASSVYGEFFQICEEAGVMTDRSVLRTSVRNNIDKFVNIEYLANVMNASLEEPLMTLDDITADAAADMDDL
ncbi:MAG: YkgJ family cysteine cluster protein, partial [Methanomassiliicoccaceae archaeon]|nr:YkgJ family cysteine cluster protein [Methanomassiliicoccaceae archaeon]